MNIFALLYPQKLNPIDIFWVTAKRTVSSFYLIGLYFDLVSGVNFVRKNLLKSLNCNSTWGCTLEKKLKRNKFYPFYKSPFFIYQINFSRILLNTKHHFLGAKFVTRNLDNSLYCNSTCGCTLVKNLTRNDHNNYYKKIPPCELFSRIL